MPSVLSLIIPIVKAGGAIAGAVGNTAANDDLSDLFQQLTRALDVDSRSSIANLARQNIAYYPLLVSSNISKDSYLKVQAILENLYANYIRLVIANSNLIFDRQTNAYTVLRQFHDNDTFDNGSGISGISGNDNLLKVGESANITFSAANLTKENFKRANIELNESYDSNFNYKIINSGKYSSEILTEARKNDTIEMYTPATYGMYLLNQINYLSKRNPKDKRIGELQKKFDSIMRIIKSLGNKRDSFSRLAAPVRNSKLSDERYEQQTKDIHKQNLAERKRTDAETANINQRTANQQAESQARQNEINQRTTDQHNTSRAGIVDRLESAKRNKSEADLAKAKADNERLRREGIKTDNDIKLKELEKRSAELEAINTQYFDRSIDTINTEVKKLNDLEPTLLKLQFPVVSESGMSLGNKTISLGIKCVTHVIDGAEMDAYLPKSIMENSLLLKLTKASTGEKRFFRDILLNVDQNKKQAYDDKGTQRFWRHLQSRAKANKILKSVGSRGFVPNSTIILSKEDVEFIKIKDNIDFFNNPTYARKIMDIYFLLHLAIIDEISETLYLFDSYTGTWQQISYKSKKNTTMNLVMPSVKY